ncbi:MAG: MFS transporter [Desulfobulbaceae bacterium]|nr:MFS transporter [Desulfobulbaceae bacterium]
MEKQQPKLPEIQNTNGSIRGDKRVIFGWSMYDWANSAYVTTIAVAVLPMYFAGVIVPEEGFRIGNSVFAAETLWGFMISAAALIVFAMVPALGAVADYCSAKKHFLFTFCAMGVTGALFIPLSGPGDVWPTIIFFVVAQVGFVGGNVFYDAFLPQISEPGEEDRVSSKGFAYGYVGGGLQFAGTLILISFHDYFGLSQSGAARIGMLSAALWWGGFALVTARYLREPKITRDMPAGFKPAASTYLVLGYSRVWHTILQVRKLKHLALFLLAFLVYNEGIQTVIQMATIYGRQELKLSAATLMVTLLLVQIVAVFGALSFSWIAGRTGTKRAVMLSLVIWSGVVIYAYFITTALQYFILGCVVGLVLGGSQAISRSFYSSLIPEDSPAEFFAFYSVVNKFSAVWGPFIFALIRHWSGSSRNAILSVIVFFILGIILLSLVNEQQARKARNEIFLDR